MAKFKNPTTGETVILRSQHVFGRHPATAHTLLGDHAASRIHANVFWDGNDWQIKDSSSNGTYLNKKKLEPGEKYTLRTADTLHFGSPDSDKWQITDLNAPKSMLLLIGNHKQTIELDDLIVLPDAQKPEITIYRNNQSLWVLENQHEQRVLNSGDQVSVGNETWVFITPDDIDETNPIVQLSNETPQLKFAVSRDEEHIDLDIQWNQQHIALGERVHHYLLLCLARKRLSDQIDGLKTEEQGWLEKELLVRMTGMDEKHINIQIYRFRKQLLDTNSSDTNALLSLIQRRRGQLRLDCDEIVIQGGQQLI
ncbi:FHA domain-containing protein [Marinicella sp. S1101]|uniref:FHA domain-containing protein n=1 Tax=Marinicella marina TaxID=2996016 RepID=UPI002260FC4A|nr:FHA domain-containing protein [Marinicella marina]MCX7553390.1 FHA domain-containing protein [Marinicella marina]MDJ1140013.1 FHA domain-containing protein [Marinicella marina]